MTRRTVRQRRKLRDDLIGLSLFLVGCVLFGAWLYVNSSHHF